MKELSSLGSKFIAKCKVLTDMLIPNGELDFTVPGELGTSQVYEKDGGKALFLQTQSGIAPKNIITWTIDTDIYYFCLELMDDNPADPKFKYSLYKNDFNTILVDANSPQDFKKQLKTQIDNWILKNEPAEK